MKVRFTDRDAVEVDLDGSTLTLFRANVSGTWSGVWLDLPKGERLKVPECYVPSAEVLAAIEAAER